MTAYDECAYTWRDGWGEHTCHLRDDHQAQGFPLHRCECDAETWGAA